MPPRAWARAAERSSSSATSSSGPAAACARCQARRSGCELGIGGLGERRVQRGALGRGCRAIGRRAHQRVTEANLGADLEQACVDRRRRGLRTGSRAARPLATRATARRPDRPPRAAAAAGCRPGAHRAAAGNRPRGCRTARPQPGAANPPASSAALMPRGSSSRASGLPRVSATIRSRTRSSSRPGNDRLEQRARVGVVEPPQRQLRQARQRVLTARLSHARTRAPPAPPAVGARRTPAPAQRRRRAIGDRRRRTTAVAPRRSQTAGRASPSATRKRSGRIAGGKTQRDPERHLLRLGEHIQPVEHRRAQLVQPRVRQFHLRLDARRSGDPEAGGTLGCVAQQRRLADARFAADDEHRAVAVARVRKQPIQPRALAGSAAEPRRTLGGHRCAQRKGAQTTRGSCDPWLLARRRRRLATPGPCAQTLRRRFGGLAEAWHALGPVPPD